MGNGALRARNILKKCSAIKSQILANFVAEWTEPGSVIEAAVPKSPWLICCNGAWGSRSRSSSNTNITFGNQAALRSEITVQQQG
jgi:hypothetical protein